MASYTDAIMQEVTPSFYAIFQKSSWWKGYQCSISDETAIPGGYFCMQVMCEYLLFLVSVDFVLPLKS